MKRVQLTKEDRYRFYKRKCREVITEHFAEQGNVFMWYTAFPININRKILNYVEDPNSLMDIGLVCKIWWRGIPDDAWYKPNNRSSFCILEYMRRRFKPNIPCPRFIFRPARLFHFEGLHSGQWAYNPKELCYVAIKGHPKIHIRSVVRKKIYFTVICPDGSIIRVGNTSTNEDIIGDLQVLVLSSVSSIFLQKKWKTPQHLVIRGKCGRKTQDILLTVKIPSRVYVYRLQKRIKSGKQIHDLKIIK